MEAIIRRLRSRVSLVISNNPDAPGIEKARRLRVPVEVVNHASYSSREEFEKVLVGKFKSKGVGLVCLAGFMRLLTGEFLRHFPTLNIHPSLLPKFKGNWRIHERVLKSGCKETGCTVHQVTEKMDDERGILKQGRVPVLGSDTAQALAARVLEEEIKLYPRVVEEVIERRITLKFPPE